MLIRDLMRSFLALIAASSIAQASSIARRAAEPHCRAIGLFHGLPGHHLTN